ncbi:hypothetical protein [Shinella sp.]|uniref:hypothetical protein n=1 Tax=Shinella sp. TaxID=1870904 RepID=UPI003D27D297
MTKPLTPEEHAAITAYALAHGESWKDDLLADWMDGRSRGTLQHLRNTRGPSWLANYSLADWPRSMFSIEPRDA